LAVLLPVLPSPLFPLSLSLFASSSLPISSYLFLSLPISSYLFLSLPISSYLFPSLPISSYLFLSPPISSHLFLSPPISSLLISLRTYSLFAYSSSPFLILLEDTFVNVLQQKPELKHVDDAIGVDIIPTHTCQVN
jgi:hypothetical protein